MKQTRLPIVITNREQIYVQKLHPKLNKEFAVSEIWYLTANGKMKEGDKVKSLPSDMKELKEMIVSLSSGVNYLERMYLRLMEDVQKARS